MATMNISLPDKMKAYIDAQVATGAYSNASDFVRDAIRNGFEKQQTLIALLEEGEVSGVSEMSVEEVFVRAREKYASRAA